MNWLTVTADLVPAPDTRLPLTWSSFTQLFLPSLLCYYATAVLVLIPGTFYARLAVLPVTLWTAFRTSTRLDLVVRLEDERLIYWNHGLALAMFTLAMRAVIWTFKIEPLYKTTTTDLKSKPDSYTITKVAKDAFDLSANLRGLGWNWSKGLVIPPETRPTHSRLAFTLSTLLQTLLFTTLFDLLHYTVQSLGPGLASPQGSTIFDGSLPPHIRYTRSTLITLFTGLTVCLGIQIGYNLLTLAGLWVFGNHPSAWPPIFDTPWFASSLADFWARRWHQVFRDMFICGGSRPLARVFGRVGSVMGAFLVSGLLHVAGLWGMGRGTEFWSVAGYFLMMGVGVVLEGVWKAVTGKRVGGVLGNVWAFGWVVVWGNWMVDAWARKGLMGSMFFGEGSRPVDLVFALGQYFI
ncbi:hypothetical protein MD484_g6774, partial [Candolleomyces efflorescens]